MNTRIETPRLVLRPFTLDDVDPLAEIFSDAETMRFIGDRKPRDRAQTERRLRRTLIDYETIGFGLMAVALKETGELIGRCGLQPLPDTPHIEIGWLIARSHWGHGYAYEAAYATLDWGFRELHLDEVRAVAFPENTASIRLMHKLGMQERGRGFYYGVTCVEYLIHGRDWLRRKEEDAFA